ncbi:MAG: type II toxin-antitoxin system HicB family antitoxin [Rhodospirillales bacterium]|jgi:predicted RNase H-like HicB family nuclease|nr:type II toxin-antitoxin system HicB family antitoxin [Rhodospirillales bacterium]
MADRYTYRVQWSADDGEYVATSAEFPSLSWLDETPEAAFAGIRHVVGDVIADMEKAGEAPPEPLSARPFSGRFQVRVPPELHRRLKIEAAEERISLNRLVNLKLSAAG